MLNYATLVIHQQSIDLNDDADPGAILDEILIGVRSGGLIISVAGRHGDVYDLIVTPSTQAYIYRRGASAGDHTLDGPWLSELGLDY